MKRYCPDPDSPFIVECADDDCDGYDYVRYEDAIELQRQLEVAHEALRRIREAGNNTTDWATWAQRTAAWGMQTGYCPEQPKDAP